MTLDIVIKKKIEREEDEKDKKEKDEYEIEIIPGKQLSSEFNTL